MTPTTTSVNICRMTTSKRDDKQAKMTVMAAVLAAVGCSLLVAIAIL
jgi:hypothetical protein